MTPDGTSDVLDQHEQHVHGILTEIEAGPRVSQRSMSSSLGIALGLTNLLVKKVVRKGWVRAVRIQPNRVRYLLTPAGLAAKAKMSSKFLHNSVRFYAAARDRVRERLTEAARQAETLTTVGAPRVVFFGADEVAEIAYVCMQETSMTLVGVVGEGRPAFFGVPVRPVSDLADGKLADVAFDLIVVASFVDRDHILALVAAQGVGDARVFWL